MSEEIGQEVKEENQEQEPEATTEPETPKRKRGHAASETGQTGPEIELEYERLNPKEKKVLKALDSEHQGARRVMKLAEIADEAFSRGGKELRNSWVRNSMRRLVRGGWVEHATEKGDGTYRVTEKGRKRLLRNLGEAEAKVKAEAEAPKRKRGRPRKEVKAAATAAAVADFVGVLDEVLAEAPAAEPAPVGTSPVVAASSPPTSVAEPVLAGSATTGKTS